MVELQDEQSAPRRVAECELVDRDGTARPGDHLGRVIASAAQRKRRAVCSG